VFWFEIRASNSSETQKVGRALCIYSAKPILIFSHLLICIAANPSFQFCFEMVKHMCWTTDLLLNIVRCLLNEGDGLVFDAGRTRQRRWCASPHLRQQYPGRPLGRLFLLISGLGGSMARSQSKAPPTQGMTCISH
jgi:hypothetical protein